MVVIALAVAVGAGSNPASAAPPTPGADAFHVNCGETVSISDAQLLANDTDPDGDAVQISQAWVFPVGVNGVFMSVSGGLSYTPDVASDGTCAASEIFTYPAVDGNSPDPVISQVTITIVPVNHAPTAQPDNFHVTCGEYLHIAFDQLLANDTDPDGDTLSTPAAWVAGPSNGFSQPAPDGWDYYATVAADGSCAASDSFTYEAVDGNGGSAAATATITIIPQNFPPDAADDFFTMECGAGVYDFDGVDLLANDSEPEGEPLAIELLAQPFEGTVTFDGDFHYTPSNAGGCLNDNFVYRVVDPNGHSDSAVVNIEFNDVADPLAPLAPQVDANTTTCSAADAANGSMEFQVFQRPDVAAPEPVLWTVANSADILATGTTPPLGPNEQVPVAVADLAAGDYDVVVSDLPENLADSTQITIAECQPSPTASGPADPNSPIAPPATDPLAGTLPATGGSAAALSVTALGLVAAGLTTLRAGRRRGRGVRAGF